MDDQIRSVHNPQVKAWAALLTRKGRERAGRFLIEGAHLVVEALKSGMKVDTILFVPDSAAVQELEGAGFRPGLGHSEPRWISVSEAVMEKVADSVTPQGVAAVLEIPKSDAVALLSDGGLFVALDAVQDPGNVGTIIRSADAVGATAVWLGAGTVDIYNPKTVRSTMGSLFHVPVVTGPLEELFALSQKAGVKMVATSLSASRTCYESDFSAGGVCILVGNEGAGVAPQWVEAADETVIVPIPGKAESLNVAMAATVLLYEALRQRRFAKTL